MGERERELAEKQIAATNQVNATGYMIQARRTFEFRAEAVTGGFIVYANDGDWTRDCPREVVTTVDGVVALAKRWAVAATSER